MARIIPELSEEQLCALRSRAEESFYRACRDTLPDEYLVVHSLCFVAPDGANRNRDGETDFMVIHPMLGLLIVELKGGGIRFDPVSSKWFSIDRNNVDHEIHDPLKQATRQKHAMFGHLKNTARNVGVRIGNVARGHAVVLPNVDNPESLSSLASAPQQIVGGRRVLGALEPWIKSVMKYWSQGRTIDPLGERGMTAVEQAFCKPVEVRPLVAESLAAEEQVRIRLTDQQAQLLRMLGCRKRAAICGGAGTGKTLLAVQKAREFADLGLRTLLLCYNRPLGDHLKRVIGKHEHLLPMTFHQLCLWRANQAEHKSGRSLLREAAKLYPVHDEFDVHYPFALASSTAVLDDRFDAIVVDEAQDFADDYWTALHMQLASEHDSYLYVFYDDNQTLYQRSALLPVEDEPFHLTINCRNTRYVHEAAYRYYRGATVQHPEILGSRIERLEGVTSPQQASQICDHIDILLEQEGLTGSDIAILIQGDGKEIHYGLLEQHQLPSRNSWAIERHGGPGVLVDTVKRFKGLEAAVVILWGLDHTDMNRDKESFYTAITRAKSQLVVVGNAATCDRFFAGLNDR